jgi:hypothetical protein
MAKRNQYNRPTLPNDMNITLYNAAAAQVSPTANFTVNADAGFLAYIPASASFTGTIDVSSMKNGQRLDIILPGSTGFLLSCSAGGGKFLAAGAFVNTSSLAAGKSYSCYKLDTVDIGGGATSNILVLASSASYTGFA